MHVMYNNHVDIVMFATAWFHRGCVVTNEQIEQYALTLHSTHCNQQRM